MCHVSDYRLDSVSGEALVAEIKALGREIGFDDVGISDIDLSEHASKLDQWLSAGFHGEMEWMERHGNKRTQPELLVAGTRSVIVVRMDYLPPDATSVDALLATPERACISRYAVGRDYHKVVRQHLKRLAEKVQERIGVFGYRVFTDSAPVLEKPLAQKVGLGWIAKHTNLLSRHAGSWFFLGEIYTDLELPSDTPVSDHCGSCRRCIDVCPTKAIVAPYQLDARRCISYLTIELESSIPEPFRKPIGNRIYGCDDCQVVCPWNRYAQHSKTADFSPREDLDAGNLVDLFAWSEDVFLHKTLGTAIRRIGHERWLRNIAVALGNAPTSEEVITALKSRQDHPSDLVREHVAWALAQHQA